MVMNSFLTRGWVEADDKCLLLFTSRSVEQMVAEGGSQAWVLNLQRARACLYVVCAWNPRGEYAQPNVNLRHGEAFLVAPITAIETAARPEPENRYIVRFANFAVPPNRKIVWTGKRNPVNYTTLSALGFDADGLQFSPPADGAAPAPPVAAARRGGRDGDLPLTIGAAKRGLSLHYGVKPEAIEIVIRG